MSVAAHMTLKEQYIPFAVCMYMALVKVNFPGLVATLIVAIYSLSHVYHPSFQRVTPQNAINPHKETILPMAVHLLTSLFEILL